MTGICNSFCMTRRIEMQLASLPETLRLSLICKALSISMLMKQKRTARWNAWSCLVIWLRLLCNLRQVTVWFESFCSVICVKLQHDSIEIAKWLGIYCTTDYLIIIRWQWILCCAMSAMLDYPDFRSYEWQRILCYAMRRFSCSNCVAVMLLKARGWRGTSLPRGSDNVWFSNPVRVLLLPITWRMRKSWTRSGFISYVHLILT